MWEASRPPDPRPGELFEGVDVRGMRLGERTLIGARVATRADETVASAPSL